MKRYDFEVLIRFSWDSRQVGFVPRITDAMDEVVERRPALPCSEDLNLRLAVELAMGLAESGRVQAGYTMLDFGRRDAELTRVPGVVDQ